MRDETKVNIIMTLLVGFTVFLICLFFYLINKQTEDYNKLTPEQKLLQSTDEIRYKKDYRTGLCYSFTEKYVYQSGYIESISQVTCTPEVLQLIENK